MIRKHVLRLSVIAGLSACAPDAIDYAPIDRVLNVAGFHFKWQNCQDTGGVWDSNKCLYIDRINNIFIIIESKEESFPGYKREYYIGYDGDRAMNDNSETLRQISSLIPYIRDFIPSLINETQTSNTDAIYEEEDRLLIMVTPNGNLLVRFN